MKQSTSHLSWAFRHCNQINRRKQLTPSLFHYTTIANKHYCVANWMCTSKHSQKIYTNVGFFIIYLAWCNAYKELVSKNSNMNHSIVRWVMRSRSCMPPSLMIQHTNRHSNWFWNTPMIGRGILLCSHCRPTDSGCKLFISLNNDNDESPQGLGSIIYNYGSWKPTTSIWNADLMNWTEKLLIDEKIVGTRTGVNSLVGRSN